MKNKEKNFCKRYKGTMLVYTTESVCKGQITNKNELQRKTLQENINGLKGKIKGIPQDIKRNNR